LNSRFTPLVIPLSVGFLIAIAIHRKWPADGFFLNLATELVGILVTVLYVDWVLSKHDKLSKHPTELRVNNRILTFINEVVLHIRTGLSISADVFDQNAMVKGNPVDLSHEVMRVADQVIKPNLLRHVRELDQIGWQRLLRSISSADESSRELVRTFQMHMSAEQLPLLIDIQNALFQCAIFPSTFPDVLGVEDFEFGDKGPSPDEINKLQTLAILQTESKIGEVISLLLRLQRATVAGLNNHSSRFGSDY
jgi:hypothetical protein